MRKIVQLNPLSSAFSNIPDPRNPSGRRYSMSSLLVTSFAAILCGANGVTDIAEWAAARNSDERRSLGFRYGRTPCIYTFWKLFNVIDTVALEKALRQYFSSLLDCEDAIAVDGKSLRGSAHDTCKAVHLLSAFGHSTRCVFNQKWVSAKTNEITTIIPLLSEIKIEGKVITADALHTQREFCQWVESQGADYVLTVKQNQNQLQEDLSDCFGLIPPL